MITSFSSETDSLSSLCIPQDLDNINDNFSIFDKFNSFYNKVREHNEKIEIDNIIDGTNKKIEIENTKYIKDLTVSKSYLNNERNSIFIVKREKRILMII